MSAWQRVPLGELLEVQNGFAFSSEEFTEQEGIPLIRIRDLKPNTSPPVRFSGSFDKRYLVNDGDLLIGMDGEFACYEWGGGAALLNQRVCRLVDFSGGIEPRFLLYGINKYLKEVEDKTTYTTVKHLSSKTIKEILFPLPSLDEQKRIVAVLDQAFAALDCARASAEANLAEAKALFEAELQLQFEKAAEGVEMLPFDSLCEALTPKLKLKRQDYLDDGAYPVVSQEADLISGYWNDASAVLEKEGDVVVFGDHTCCLKYVDFDFVVGADGTKVLQPSNGISGKFLYYGLRSQSIRQTGYARHFKLLREKALPNLSIPEQKRITDHLDQIEVRCGKLSEAYVSKLKDIAALRQSLLQAAFSGQLT